METTKLSSKGQVIIPRRIRSAHHWEAGLELSVVELEGGILLKPKAPFMPTSLDEVAGSLADISGADKTQPGNRKPKTDADIQRAMRQAARKTWRDSD